MTISARASAASAVTGSAQSRLGSTLRSRHAFSGASAPSIRAASSPLLAGRAPTSCAPTVLAPSTSQPKLAPVCSAIQRPRRSSVAASGCCEAALPSRTALRSPLCSAVAIALAPSLSRASAGAATPLAAAITPAMSASACGHALGATATLAPIGISQSSRSACTLMTLAPRLVAARRRTASSGRSLRRNEPTTSTRCSSASEAIGRPSQRMAPPGGCGASSRSRVSTLSLPSPRTSFASRCSSSTVLIGCASAPTLCGPCSTEIWVSPRAT